MEFECVCTRVELPHEDSFRWRRLQALYKTLQAVKDSQSLIEVMLQIYRTSGHDIFSEEYTTVLYEGHAQWNPFYGLKIFLDTIATTSETTLFFESILPKIIFLASELGRRSGSSGLLRSRRQEPFQVSLSGNFVESILASCFLCTVPPSSIKTKTSDANFITLFCNIQRSEYKDEAASTLRNFLQYFDELSLNKLDEIVYQRQVVKKLFLPSIMDWECSDAKLCPLIVIHNKAPHLGMSSHQVCCSCFNSDEMAEGHLMSMPEAAVAMVFMEPLEDNELLIVKRGSDNHVERFIGRTDRETEEDSPREMVLRYLNRALVCFQSQNFVCELMKTQSMNAARNDELDGFECEEWDEDLIKSNNPGQEDARDEIEISRQNAPMNVHIEVTDINDSIFIPGIDTFCDSLISNAFRQAKHEIDINSRVSADDHRDMLENLMKKSLHEVFWKTPEKEKQFTDSIIYSPLLPKCLLHFHPESGIASPIVPNTPPSTPAKRGLGSSSSSTQQSFLVSPLGAPLVDQLRVGTKSFADSLAEALMSCVLLSSSLATSIATETLDSLSITSVTMEMLQNSPSKVLKTAGPYGHSSPNEKKVQGFSQLDNTLFHGLSNGNTDSDLIDISPESSSFDSDEEQEARRRSLNELALNLFENYADKLAQWIIQSSTRVIYETPLDSVNEQYSGIERNLCGSGSGSGSDSGSGINSFEVKSSVLRCYEGEASFDTEIDSDVTSEGHWHGLDIDKEFEDKFYELDLIDNEDDAPAEHFPRIVERMADDMLTMVFFSAFSEASFELENMDSTVEYLHQDENNYHTDDFSVENEAPENVAEQKPLLENCSHLSSDTFQQYAFDLSSGVLQSAVGEFTIDKSDSLSFSSTPLSQSTTDFGSVTEKEEIDENRRESLESINSNPDLVQYAQVLSKHLIETSVAVAGIACGSRAGCTYPVITSGWGSENVGIDLQMEAMLQWVAASIAGCPAVTFHSLCDKRLEEFSKVHQALRERNYRVCDILDMILRYSQSDVHTGDMSHNLFQFLLDRIR